MMPSLILHIKEPVKQHKYSVLGVSWDGSIKTLWHIIEDMEHILSPMNSIEKLMFYEQMGHLLKAGVAIHEAVLLLLHEFSRPSVQHILKRLYDRLVRGNSLSTALRQENNTFPEAVLAVIEAGEKSGRLVETFEELTHEYRQMYHFEAQIRKLFVYPKIVLCVMILLSIVFITLIIPRLKDFFGDTSTLPMPTKLLVYSSDFVISYWYFIILIVLILFIIMRYIASTMIYKRVMDIISLQIPVIKDIVRRLILIRFTRTANLLLSSGVPLPDTLQLCSEVVSNTIYKDKLQSTVLDITRGVPLAEHLSGDKDAFPPLLIQLLRVGEETGSLDTAFYRASEYFGEDMENRLTKLSQYLEPILLLFLAALTTFFILAVYLPIINLNDVIMKGVSV